MGRRSFLAAWRPTVNSYAPPRAPGLLEEVASAKVCAQPEYVNDPRGDLLLRSARRVRSMLRSWPSAPKSINAEVPLPARQVDALDLQPEFPIWAHFSFLNAGERGALVRPPTPSCDQRDPEPTLRATRYRAPSRSDEGGLAATLIVLFATG